MRIDTLQPQLVNPQALQARQEVPGEREPDGDADDMTARVARNAPAAPKAPKLEPQGVGTKVDLFA